MILWWQHTFSLSTSMEPLCGGARLNMRSRQPCHGRASPSVCYSVRCALIVNLCITIQVKVGVRRKKREKLARQKKRKRRRRRRRENTKIEKGAALGRLALFAKQISESTLLPFQNYINIIASFEHLPGAHSPTNQANLNLVTTRLMLLK